MLLVIATFVDNDPLLNPPGETWGRQVSAADNGDTVAIVTDSPGERSLMNASESVNWRLQARHPGAVVVGLWPDDAPPIGPCRRSSGDGGGTPVPREQWVAWGIPLLDELSR